MNILLRKIGTTNIESFEIEDSISKLKEEFKNRNIKSALVSFAEDDTLKVDYSDSNSLLGASEF